MKNRSKQKTLTITGNLAADLDTLAEIYADKGWHYGQHIAASLERAARDWRATLALALDDRKQGLKYWENNGRYIVRAWNNETEPGDYCRDFSKQQVLDY
jgi:hypothetical protein